MRQGQTVPRVHSATLFPKQPKISSLGTIGEFARKDWLFAIYTLLIIGVDFFGWGGVGSARVGQRGKAAIGARF